MSPCQYWSDEGWTSWGGWWNASDWHDGWWSSSWDNRDWGQASTAVVSRSCQTAAAEWLVAEASPRAAAAESKPPVTEEVYPGPDEGTAVSRATAASVAAATTSPGAAAEFPVMEETPPQQDKSTAVCAVPITEPPATEEVPPGHDEGAVTASGAGATAAKQEQDESTVVSWGDNKDPWQEKDPWQAAAAAVDSRSVAAAVQHSVIEQAAPGQDAGVGGSGAAAAKPSAAVDPRRPGPAEVPAAKPSATQATSSR